jgi:hypothetical protein
MVGDELKAYVSYHLHVKLVSCSAGCLFLIRARDYHGALAAGLEARLIRRDGEWSDGAARHVEEDLKGVEVVRSLDELLDEVRLRAGSS